LNFHRELEALEDQEDSIKLPPSSRGKTSTTPIRLQTLGLEIKNKTAKHYGVYF
jgi:hypothetical protein